MEKTKQQYLFGLIWIAILLLPEFVYWLIVRDVTKTVDFMRVVVGIGVPLGGLIAWRMGFTTRLNFIGATIMGVGLLIAGVVDWLDPELYSPWSSIVQSIALSIGLIVQFRGASQQQAQLETPLPYLPSFPKLMFMFFATMMLVYGITRLTEEYIIDPFVLIVFVILPILLLALAVAHTFLTRERPRA